MTLGSPINHDIGKIRGLQRITAADGMINACALDVLDMLAQMLVDLGRPASHRDIVSVKHELISVFSAQASAILTDAQYGLPAIAAGALNRSAGLIVTIEDEDYDVESPLSGRRTVFRDGWTPAEIRRAGGDAAKLLWFYRADRNPETAEHQRRVLQRVAEQCAEESLALVVEPIWYALPDEDPADPVWRAARLDGIVQSLVEAEALGADLIKAEFPGYLDAEGGLEAARRACEKVSALLTVPWVILSAGVTFELFKEQVRLACQAGASGYLAGRAVWRDIVQAPLGQPHDEAVRLAVDRVQQLNAISQECGTPFAPIMPLQEALDSIPERWYAKEVVLA